MPYMMAGQMGPGSNMRLPGPQRNAGMQQIPPSGPMMRAQVQVHPVHTRELKSFKRHGVCVVSSVMSYK